MPTPATSFPLSIPSRAGDIVGIILDAASATAAAPVTFGQGFAAGAVRPGASLVLRTEAGAAAAQMDVKTIHPDGSVATAVMTVAAPAIGAGGVVQGVLSVAAPAPGTPAVDLAHALSGYDLSAQFRIQNAGGGDTTINLDLDGAMRDALARGEASFWMKGPLATQARVDVKVSGSLHVTLDLTAHADGTVAAEIGFDNDLAMGATGGTVRYAATVTENGQVVHRTGDLTQFQYQNHHVTLHEGEAAAPNLRHDVAYLQAAGFVPDFDFSGGVSNGTVAAMRATMARPDWDAPFASNGIFQYMPNTGGRADIGPTTQANWAWLARQDAATAAYALGQADAADGIPWHFRDVATGTWVTTDRHPALWVDGRGGDGGTTGLTQRVDTRNNGWTTDTAHQPSLSGIPYLLTGSRHYLDELNAQAAQDVVSVWSEPRGNAQDLLLPADQIRGAAWSLREIGLAAQLNPTGSPEKAYFKAVEDGNWSWLVQQIPTWTREQGEVFGRLGTGYAEHPGHGYVMTTWQEDFFAIVAAEAAGRGNADAKTFLQWQSNWLVGRFLHAAEGFNPHDGIAYEVARRGGDGAMLATWGAIGGQQTARGISNGDGWATSDGYYGQVAAAALAGVISVTGSTDAMKAYAWLINSGAPHVQGGADSQFDTAPRMSDGGLLTSDHVRIAATGTVTRGTDVADLIQGAGGNERLEGGGGADLLVAGAGQDILLGGAGDDVLFGGSGTAILAGAAGRNHLESGTGATTFAFRLNEAAADTVKGYRPGTDTIRLVDGNGADISASAAAAILSGATADGAGNTVLHLSAGHEVTVLGVARGSLRIGTGGELNLGPEDTTPLTSNDPLFDAAYYLSHNPDVYNARVDARAHFDAYGAREGRNPNGFFDMNGYLAANPDVRAAGLNPLDHYRIAGFHEGRDPSSSFDVEGYLARNADVRAAGVDPLTHYLSAGLREGRLATSAVGHDIQGIFDREAYLLANKDVGYAGVDPFIHFVQFGEREGRNPDGYFDTARYLVNNPDVAAAGMSPTLHYLQYGAQEGRDPSAAFDTDLYLLGNPDVAAAGINPLVHYLLSGAEEGRLPVTDGIF